MKAFLAVTLCTWLALGVSAQFLLVDYAADPNCPIPSEGENATLLPNPSNCSQYFECVHGEAVPMDCPPNMHFNPELLVCDHIWNAGCEKMRSDPHCPPESEGHNATLFPNANNCSQYFECAHGEAILMDCPPNMHFNAELLVCDHIWHAGCEKKRSDARCPPSEGSTAILFPDPYNCKQYYECSNGEAYHMNCPTTLHFNPNLLVCDYEWHAGCLSSGKHLP